MAATMGSEATAAAVDQAAIRRDPMAMLPFCGYNMADYWSHWLKLGAKITHAPKIFRVNWFRKDENGEFIWPGFGENMRVLSWIFDRVNDTQNASQSPFGYMPRHQDLNWNGLDFCSEDFNNIMSIDRDRGIEEANAQHELFVEFGEKLPTELERQRQALKGRLKAAPPVWRSPS